MRQFFLRALAYVVIAFPLAIVWHIVAFRDVYESLGYIGRDEPIFALGFLAIATQGLVLSYLYPLFRRGGNPTREGLTFVFVTGLFLWSSHVAAAAAKAEISPLCTFFAVETAYLVVQFALAGIAFTLISDRGDREAVQNPTG